MSASDVEEQAARWLMRREEPGWTQSDQRALEAWLDESPAHKAGFWRLEHGWRAADRLRSLANSEATDEAIRPGPRRRWHAAALAASLVALAIVPGSMDRPRSEQARAVHLSTPVGGHAVVPMPDGSRVELNTATRLRAVVGRLRREVWLDRGEAYFEVAHSPDHPFIVHAGPRTVTVLGTKFSVRRSGDEVVVAVVEGRVRIDGGPGPEPSSSTVTGGDIAIARDTSVLVTASRSDDVAGLLSWRDGVIDLDRLTLAGAAAEFNRYHRTKIDLAGPGVAALRLGGRIRADNLDGFVALLQQAYGLRVERSGDVIKISD